MSLFSPESKLYKGLSFFASVLLLNFCWILFSLPIITVGASTLAAYSVVFKMLENKEGYVFKDFWKGFKENWKQGTVLWLITLVAIYGFYLDVQILKTDPGIPVIVASIVAFVLVAFSLIYAYPLAARYENKVFFHIKNSFLLSVSYLGRTFFLVLILFTEIGVFLWNTHTLIFLVLVGPAVLIYSVAGSAKKIFSVNDEKNKNAT
ncbi:MAG: YesL family protein [Treponema sp.]|nr:YesL family protein [Treponema sp.]MEE3314284.1 YesL family protein [Treponema sp.]